MCFMNDDDIYKQRNIRFIGVVNMSKFKKYYDGVSISPKLPDSYELAKGTSKCMNCSFFISAGRFGGYCEKWKALVRRAWVCKAWKQSENADIHTSPNNNSNTGGNTGGGY